MHKLLVIRFGSIGDIIQALGIPQAFKTQFPESEVHWLTKQDFSYLVEFNPSVNKVLSIPQGTGILSLIKLAANLRFSGYTHVYDAHNNLRSFVVIFVMRLLMGKFKFLRRPKNRWK